MVHAPVQVTSEPLFGEEVFQARGFFLLDIENKTRYPANEIPKMFGGDRPQSGIAAPPKG
jgi:hypothetical protein